MSLLKKIKKVFIKPVQAQSIKRPPDAEIPEKPVKPVEK